MPPRRAGKKSKIADEGSDFDLDEEGDYEDIAERKPAKRSKTAPTKTTRKPAKKSVRAQPKDSLAALPLDVLNIILELSDPSAVYQLSRTSRAFRSLVRPAVWRAAWANADPELPHPPKDTDGAAWAGLLFGADKCQRCRRRKGKLAWSIRARLCDECVKTSNRLKHNGGGAGIPVWRVNMIIPSVKIKYQKHYEHHYVFKRDMDALSKAVDEAKAKGTAEAETYLTQRERDFAAHIKFVQKCERWVLKCAEDAKNAIANLKKARVVEIHARIAALGYEEADMINVDAVEGVAVAKKLTDKEWDELWDDLRHIVNRDKTKRIQHYAAQRKAERLESATRIYQERLISVPIAERMYWPNVKQIRAMKPFADYVDRDNGDDESYLESRDRRDAALDETIVMVEAALKTHRLKLANKILASADEDVLGTDADPMPALSRATSVFKIPSGYPNARIGFEVLAEETKEWRSPVLDNFCDEHPAEASKIGAEAAKQMVALAGLPHDASINDMDKKDMPFLCAKCGPTVHTFQTNSRDPFERDEEKRRKGERVLSWRTAIEHVLDRHGYKEDLSEVTIRALTPTEYAALKAKHYRDFRFNHSAPAAFGCAYCTYYTESASKEAKRVSQGLLTMSQIRKHIKNDHQDKTSGRATIQEGVDFWYHPRFERGLLGSTIVKFWLLENPGEEAQGY
ncbi:hypothetical protein PENSPDRAFT_353871 [Peniophora sp. CONT]|nr:hypothetical protein PENSPDRAFT_353871 [Peniophora sp. CONT]